MSANVAKQASVARVVSDALTASAWQEADTARTGRHPARV